MKNTMQEKWDRIDQSQLRRLAYSVLGSREAAEDVVQDTLEKYIKHHGHFRVSAQAWLMQTTRNAAIDRYRRLQTEHRVLREWSLFRQSQVQDDEATPESVLGRIQLRRQLLSLLLRHASERDVAMVLLRDVFDVEYWQLAEYAASSKDACRQRVHRTRKRIPVPARQDKLVDCVQPAGNPLFETAIAQHRAEPLIDLLRTMPDCMSLAESSQCSASALVFMVYRRGRLCLELRMGETVLCALPARQTDVESALSLQQLPG